MSSSSVFSSLYRRHQLEHRGGVAHTEQNRQDRHLDSGSIVVDDHPCTHTRVWEFALVGDMFSMRDSSYVDRVKPHSPGIMTLY